MTFWDWFVRPFAEMAAGIAVAIALLTVYVLLAVVIHIKRKFWK